MSKTPRPPAARLVAKLREDMADLAEQARGADLTPRGRRKLSQEIERAAGDLNALLAELDRVKRPRALFDPGNPRTIGFFIALAVAAQPRQPLGSTGEFYGSGVYAIYYNGDYPLYEPLRGTETPFTSEKLPRAMKTPALPWSKD